MEPLSAEGFDRLLSTLTGLGVDDVPDCEPLDSGHSLVVETFGMTLAGALERDWPFEQAWSSAINRIQPSQVGGVIDAELDTTLRETRALLEEDRSIYQAAYEGRETTPRERAGRLSRTWARTGNSPGQNRRRVSRAA